jgi:hypothetical protein
VSALAPHLGLSPTALRLFARHKPGIPAYLSWALGPLLNRDGLAPLDRAYAELIGAGLLKPSEATLSVLPGVTRPAFLLTEAGERAKQSWTKRP